MTADQKAERETLLRLLSKREGQAGYETNVAEIRARIAELEASGEVEG